MKIFSDIMNFISALKFVDIVFFFAVLILMILIVTLIYFIMINNEEDENINETAEMKIVKDIKENMDSSKKTINFTEYEKDQEDKAIISYDELLNKSNKTQINYEKEETHDDVTIRKIDLDNLSGNESTPTTNIEVRVISFAKEEAFLQALKQLQKELG